MTLLVLIILAAIIIAVICARFLDYGYSPYNCNGDCNQGRNCTCGSKD